MGEVFINENEGFIIDCNRPHVYFTEKGNSWSFAWIHFRGVEAFKQIEFILNSQGPLLSPVENELALNQVNKIIDILPEKGLNADVKISVCLNKILSTLLLNCSESNNVNIPSEINAALEFIETNYNCKISVEKLAKKIYMNKFDLIRKFKRYVGSTPYEYLIKYRLSVAKNLLESTSDSVTEIAASTGFESLSYFIKVFKQHEKTTPAKYRRLF